MDFVRLGLVFLVSLALYLLRMSLYQPVLQFSEPALHLLAVGSFMSVPSCPSLDTNGLALPDLSLCRLRSFLLYHMHLHIETFCSSLQLISIYLVCPAFQLTGLWMASESPFLKMNVTFATFHSRGATPFQQLLWYCAE